MIAVDYWRRELGEKLIRGVFRTLVRALSLDPRRQPEYFGIRVTRDLAYREGGSPRHRLDVYSPPIAGTPRPAIIYIHGGGFTGLSKDTHALMALEFAKRGYVVFNIDYRLAPEHPFPAAPSDVCAAYTWIVANAARYGADVTRLGVAGESAGANLACVLAIAACYEREEPWARAVFQTGVVPRVLLPACGQLQVSAPERHFGDAKLSFLIRDRIEGVTRKYLERAAPADRAHAELADPLLVFERGVAPARPLPACFAIAGDADPIFTDGPRLHAALQRLGVDSTFRVYPGGHVFHAQVWNAGAQRAWRETFAFLTARLGVPSSAPVG